MQDNPQLVAKVVTPVKEARIYDRRVQHSVPKLEPALEGGGELDTFLPICLFPKVCKGQRGGQYHGSDAFWFMKGGWQLLKQ